MKYTQYAQPTHNKTGVMTPVDGPIPGRTDMQPNLGGGYGFSPTELTRLDRFLVLGTEGGCFYATERELTEENISALKAFIDRDGVTVVNRIVEISSSGRAPRNDVAVFALAYAAGIGDPATRRAAEQAIPKVCRTGTHLFGFADAVQRFRGWGRGLRDAIAAHYTETPLDALVHEVIKYGQRDGWTHRDLIRLSHPRAADEARNALFRYLVRPDGPVPSGPGLDRLAAAIELKNCRDPNRAVGLITAHDLPRETVPTELLNNKAVWAALLDRMPITATIRNLGKMTSIGLLEPFGRSTELVADRIANEETLKRGRVHPLTILSALRVYGTGHGQKGRLQWTPVGRIGEALEAAFYLAFKTIQPTGKNIVLGIDVSGSMDQNRVTGIEGLSCREAAAVMAMVTARTEANAEFLAFSNGIIPLQISRNDNIGAVIEKMSILPFDRTRCSAPIEHAIERKWADIGAFVIYTDNETNAGVHPAQALMNYRSRYRRDAKLAVVAFESSGTTIADPADPGMLDLVGLDSAGPQVLADFIRS